MAIAVDADVAGGLPAGSIYVGGEWRTPADGGTYEKRSPLSPDRVLAQVAAAGRADAETAIAAADAVRDAWAATAPARVSALLAGAARALEARADVVAACMVQEVGKPIREARGEVLRGAQILDFYAGEPLRAVGEAYRQGDGDGLVYAIRRPVGVVGLITPWNFPVAIPLWKLAPALAHGNTVVMKLASEAPLTGLHVAACFAEAGLPAGVLNVLTGSGSLLGGALVEDPRVKAISFTGSVAVGRAVRDHATALGKRVQLELGGHSPLVVMADADLAAAAQAAVAGAFSSAGQKCTATRRILVQSSVYDDFRALLLERIAAANAGDPRDAATDVGALVSPAARDEVLGAVRGAVDAGATLLAGGEPVAEGSCVLAPTLLEGVAPDAPLACEEVFGPVTALYPFEDFEDAVARCNALELGLAAAIYTRDLGVAASFARRVEAGIVRVNGPTVGADVHVPFGGLKESGFGPHEQGRAAVEFYTETVTVYQTDRGAP